MVKIKKLTLIIVLLCQLLTVGCTKQPINSEVEGFWMLKSFVTLSDGKTHQCERLYYSITRMVTEVAEKEGELGLTACVARTGYNEDQSQLLLTDFKVRRSTSDSKKDATIEELNPYGINNQELTVFDIIYCNGKVMTLQSDYARLELERF